MKIAAFVVFLLASGANSLFLSLSCLSAYKSLYSHIDEFSREFQARVCDQGCVVSYQSYHEIFKEQHTRPFVKQMVAQYFSHRETTTEEDTNKLLEIHDMITEVMLQECIDLARDKSPTPRSIEAGAPGDLNICEDPSVFQVCKRRMKSKIPSLVFKHMSDLRYFTDEETCKRVPLALKDPQFWALFEKSMDAWVDSCPSRV